MNLSNIGIQGRRKSKRVGRGTGSGKGKTSGRGHKGAGQRKGKKLPYAGFRGGSLPYARVIPKRGFTSPCKKEYQIVNLSDIQEKVKGINDITPEILKKNKLINSRYRLIKILAAKIPFTEKLTIKADKFSKKAKESIEAAGGIAECLSR